MKPVLKPSAWRVRGLMLLEKAADAETYAEEAKRAAAYEGTYNGMGRRECALAKVVYENQDLYVGSYEDDLRSGKGMYVFANKGAYAGECSSARPGHQHAMSSSHCQCHWVADCCQIQEESLFRQHQAAGSIRLAQHYNGMALRPTAPTLQVDTRAA